MFQSRSTSSSTHWITLFFFFFSWQTGYCVGFFPPFFTFHEICIPRTWRKPDHHIHLKATMKMAGLLWMSVSVLLFQSCAGVTQNQLGLMVKEIWKNYHPGKMFSIAESIPKIQNGYDVNHILKAEKPATVNETITRGDVYMHGRIVAATFTSKPGGNGDRHAEYRVLQNFDNLINQPFDYDNDFMLFYVLAAPCVQKCTNENNQENILKDLEKLKKWRNYAFVFTYLYKAKNENMSTSDKDRKDGIDKLGRKLGLENVFRCIKIAGRMECRTCAKQDKTVEEFCFSDPPSP